MTPVEFSATLKKYLGADCENIHVLLNDNKVKNVVGINTVVGFVDQWATDGIDNPLIDPQTKCVIVDRLHGQVSIQYDRWDSA